MKQWKCVQANSHDSVGPIIEAIEKDGWTLHTYSTAHAKVALGGVSFINHYLLFMKEDERNVERAGKDYIEPELSELAEKLSKKFIYPERALKGFIEVKMSQGKTREQAIREIEEEYA